jgi:hypothetical protein
MPSSALYYILLFGEALINCAWVDLRGIFCTCKAEKLAKLLSSPGRIVRFIAASVFPTKDK